MSVVSIIGAGSWGTSLSILLNKNGHDVRVWSLFQEEVDMLNNEREHKNNLPGVKIPDTLRFTTDMKECLEGHNYIVLVVPSQAFRDTCKILAPYVYKDDIAIICSKGLEEETGMRLSVVMLSEIPNSQPVALYGPSHAEEVAAGIPTTVVAASLNREAAMKVQDLFMAPDFRVYTSPDLVGAEIGSALKNIIALCGGISDGLGYGDNSKAALITRGLTEIARLGKAMGASSKTFAGLTGIGDIIVTCTSNHSRNLRAGRLIGQGYTVEEAQKEVRMVVEGISATRAAKELADKYKVSMPIIQEAYKILFEGKQCKKLYMT